MPTLLTPTVAAALLALSLSGCAGSPFVPSAAIPLVASDGAVVGSVTMRRDGSVTIAATHLAPGDHGLHLHDKGRCEGPGFTSAGGHWNPAGRQHGRDNPLGAHAGDLPNLFVDTSGRGALKVVIPRGWQDADGAALVVHAKPDDYRTDPSGASGERVACAVIAAPKG